VNEVCGGEGGVGGEEMEERAVVVNGGEKRRV